MIVVSAIPLVQFSNGHSAPDLPGKQLLQLVAGSKLWPQIQVPVPDTILVSAIPLLQFNTGHPVPDRPGKHVVQFVAGSLLNSHAEHVPPTVVISDTLAVPVLQFLTEHPKPERPGKHVVQLVDESYPVGHEQ
jgi:hypothetical protein